jgi:electron transport complex protein RnfB
MNLACAADAVDALLPQTQCTRCGYEGCRPYAEAIVAGAADINRCPPGGTAVIARLADLTGRPARALDPACGAEQPLAVAVIDETRCIGCTLCIAACPVDAILGAAKRMHAVVPSLCSGCELCLAPCPVDCIEMRPASRAWTGADADAARTRHQARIRRLERAERMADRAHAARDDAAAAHAGLDDARTGHAAPGETAPAAGPRRHAAAPDAARRAQAVAAALARARARRASTP